MDVRDDVYEYSLDNHHGETEGKKIRTLFLKVLAVLSLITIVEVAMGMMWSRDESMRAVLKYSFILMTLVKAGGITWYFMHMGDEKKTFQYVVIVPFFVMIGYLIFIALTEATYLGTIRPSVENYLGF
ncbi:MAG: cytochrome C oxidase subunit IV family protein [Flavobacteriales bacterium]|nr:cytochrome C oxidase subunit IV family protein [Flavobacteriales bacterium]